MLIARLFIRPLLALVAATGNEEVFTATALVIALAAGWATGQIGLSLTLGAFLGGLTLAETPYRVVIQSEIAPFRGLLLGFFFIYVGFSLDVPVIAHYWYAVVGIAALFVAVKVMTNIAASLVFRWSVPGSTQLGFLLSQGSEFAFVILSLPAVRALVGESRASVLVAAVALSMAATPNLAELGRSLAGSMRRRQQKAVDPELIPRATTAPVIIVGMGRIGRTVADALIGFEIGYVGIERDQRRLREAIADGYSASFGDAADIRMWQSVEMQSRRISVLTAPRFESVSDNTPVGSGPVSPAQTHRGRDRRGAGGAISQHRRQGDRRARHSPRSAHRRRGPHRDGLRSHEDRRMDATVDRPGRRQSAGRSRRRRLRKIE